MKFTQIIACIACVIYVDSKRSHRGFNDACEYSLLKESCDGVHYTCDKNLKVCKKKAGEQCINPDSCANGMKCLKADGKEVGKNEKGGECKKNGWFGRRKY
jgi:hypothetical protein